jgi:hypothetical protein
LNLWPLEKFSFSHLNSILDFPSKFPRTDLQISRMKWLGFVFTLFLAELATAQEKCSREILQKSVQNYLQTQATGKSALTLSDSGLTYTENFKNANIQTGILSKGIQIAHNRSLIDTTQCATFTELIAHENNPPYVIGTQMRFDATGRKLTKMESLVTTNGDWLFNAKQTYSFASKENRNTIPEEKRDSRKAIQAAADAYLDVFNDKSVVVPWGEPCERLEGGMHVAPKCSVGVPNGVKLVNRRYVVDETVGTVSVFLSFGGPGGMPDGHEFRLENGKLRFVHTITVGGFGGPAKGGAGRPKGNPSGAGPGVAPSLREASK